MAAALKVTSGASWRAALGQQRVTFSVLRCMSSSQKYPWSPQSLPSGDSFKAIRETKKQNPLMKAKQMKVMDGWKEPLVELYKEKQTSAPEPEVEPAKLHMVIRVKGMKGRPKTEKDILTKLGLDGKRYKPVMVKNSELTNKLLQQVKHLVQVQQVSFPYGLPDTEDDYEHCYLRDNGELVVQRKIQPVSEESEPIKVSAPSSDNVWEMDEATLQKALRRKKENHGLLSEYFKTKYIYSNNQDEKEHRYQNTDNIGEEQTWH